jgi:hypothetical protein
LSIWKASGTTEIDARRGAWQRSDEDLPGAGQAARFRIPLR